MGGLVLFNTLHRRKEAFEPSEAGHVRMYTCGPTVYGPPHIGNLRANLFPDLLKRTLLAEGYRVTHVINVTDVGHLVDDSDDGDDKVEAEAERTGRRAQDITAEYTAWWLRDREALHCLAPEVVCKATEHIPHQIALAEKLDAGGYLYRLEDGMYFDTARFPRYADLAKLDVAGQESTERVGDVAGKRNGADFAVWKFAQPGVQRQQEWDSPWGRGFPGWHLECSAMSVEYLGEQFDIHTGGVDHIPVHHSNEIAQTECALDVHPWVRFWLHNEFLVFDREKMAKSKGNVLVLDDLVERGFPALAFRYFFLQAHYRQQQTMNDDAMEAASIAYRRLLEHAASVRDAEGEVDPARVAEPRERFREALRDDLNAPRALAVAIEVARSRELTPAERRALLLEFDQVLGLDLAHGVPAHRVVESDPRIDGLVADRQAARKAKDWAEADRIRDVLLAEGITIDDTPDGPRWRRT